MSERLDRIKRGRTPGGHEAEQDAGGGGENKSDDIDPGVEHEWRTNQFRERRTHGVGEDNAWCSSHARQRVGFHEELEKDLAIGFATEIEVKKPVGKEAILEVLSRAADDHRFLARLAEDPAKVLQEFDLNMQERAALASGDIRRLESWIGKLDKRLRTWPWCRLQQEKW